MKRRKPPELIGGPYRAPSVQVGELVPSVAREYLETVDGFTEAPIPWPYTNSVNGRRRLIFWGDLVDAVKAESLQAVIYHWGVARSTVQSWRRLLDVGESNTGTLARWTQIERERPRPPGRSG